MLVEDTGISLLDSGSDDGRNYERNKKKTLRAFESEPAVKLEIPTEPCSIGDISYTISVFHYLKDQLDLDLLSQEFNRRNKVSGDWDSELLPGVGAKAEKWLKRKNTIRFHGTINSYNYESNLSQVIQYTPLTINDKPYVLLQIHGGCDIRGGYTTGRLFKVENEVCYEVPHLNPETVQVTVVKPDGWKYGCSNSEGNNLKVDDGAIYPPGELIVMDFDKSGLVHSRAEVELIFNPGEDQIHAWLAE